MTRQFVALALMAIATPALADDPSSVTDVKPAKEKKVCRRQPPIGTNIPKSTCHTAAEWRLIDRANNDAAAQTIANGRTSGR